MLGARNPIQCVIFVTHHIVCPARSPKESGRGGVVEAASRRILRENMILSPIVLDVNIQILFRFLFRDQKLDLTRRDIDNWRLNILLLEFFDRVLSFPVNCDERSLLRELTRADCLAVE